MVTMDVTNNTGGVWKVTARSGLRRCKVISVVVAALGFTAVLYCYGAFLKHKNFTLRQKSGPRPVQEAPFVSSYVNRHLKYNQSTRISVSGYHEILWWNEPSWMVRGNLISYCNMSLCEYSNCKVATNRAHKNRSSAILVSIVVHDGPVDVSHIRAARDQALVFFSRESPNVYARPVFQEWNNLFNWSMSYQRDSDIFIPNGWLGRRDSPLDKNYSEIFRKKTKQVAWAVSHCNTHGKRENYVKELQKYIQVDTYGKCNGGHRLSNEALGKQLPHYKFYLGFENALCRDYVTEKYFQYLKHDLIVVVRGLADYNNLLPRETFINTADFASIKSLGEYLNKLANDEVEYTKYIKEMNRYVVSTPRDTYCDGLCTICEKVNNLDANRRTYGNIVNWSGRCEKPQD